MVKEPSEAPQIEKGRLTMPSQARLEFFLGTNKYFVFNMSFRQLYTLYDENLVWKYLFQTRGLKSYIITRHKLG